MSSVITRMEVSDIRFPTSLELDGSDAMNADPDYSVAYVVLHTDDPAAPTGHGFTFTCGRGTEVVVAAIKAMEPLVLGTKVDRLRTGMGAFARSLVADPQLRWLGPEKGVMALATAAVVNAAWDLWAKWEGKPVWKLLVDLTPEQVVELVDFRYIDDVLSPESALEILRAREPLQGPGGSCAARAWAEGLHHVGRLAGLQRRQDRGAAPGGDSRRVRRGEAEGRCRPGRRRAPVRPRPFDRRAEPAVDGRRQPGLGCRRGDPVDDRARAVRSVVDRGTDQP